MARDLDQDELIDRWTLGGDELNVVAGKRGVTKLGFALLMRFYTERGRFPRRRGEIPYAAVDYVARQVAVGATEIAFYEWSGRTIEFHRAQIRKALGFREGSVAHAEAEWLVTNVTQSERRGERVREQLMAGCRDERIEPPTSGRIDRIIRSALSRGEDLLFANRRDEREMSVLCLRILQAALVYVNTLMLQDIFADPDWRGGAGRERATMVDSG